MTKIKLYGPYARRRKGYFGLGFEYGKKNTQGHRILGIAIGFWLIVIERRNQ